MTDRLDNIVSAGSGETAPDEWVQTESQLFFELGKCIDPFLIDVFISRLDLLGGSEPVDTGNENAVRSYLARTALRDVLNNSRKRADISYSIKKNNAGIRSTRKQIFQQFSKAAKGNFSDSKNIFHQLYSEYTLLSCDKFKKLYGTDSFDSLVSSYMCRIRDWAEDKTCHLSSFPYQELLMERQIVNMLWRDIAKHIGDCIKERFDGSLETFILSVPSSFANIPLFSVRDEGSEVVPLIYDVGGNEGEYLVSHRKEADSQIYYQSALKRLDSVDLSVINFLLGQVRIDKDFLINRKVSFSFKELLKHCYSFTPGSNNRNELVRRLLNLIALHEEWHTGSSIIAFNYFDSIAIKKDSKSIGDVGEFDEMFEDFVDEKDPAKDVCVVLGDTLFNAIRNHMLITVTRFDYESLEDKYARILMHTVQNERILSSIRADNVPQKMTGSYDMMFFLKSIRLPLERSSRALSYVEGALNDFKNKEVYISDYKILNNDEFILYFIPLSAEEKSDLSSYNSYKKLGI